MRVVIAGGDSFFRSGLRDLLEQDGIEVAAEAGSPEELIEVAGRAAPEVVTVDGLPRMPSADAARLLAGDRAAPKVLVLSESGDLGEVAECIEAGASGYVTKRASEAELVAAVRTVAAGGAAFSAPIARALAELALPPERERSPEDALSDRELAVLRLVAEGKDNAQIARELLISRETVKNHMSTVLAKLHVENRVQAAVYAVRSRIV